MDSEQILSHSTLSDAYFPKHALVLLLFDLISASMIIYLRERERGRRVERERVVGGPFLLLLLSLLSFPLSSSFSFSFSSSSSSSSWVGAHVFFCATPMRPLSTPATAAEHCSVGSSWWPLSLSFSLSLSVSLSLSLSDSLYPLLTSLLYWWESHRSIVTVRRPKGHNHRWPRRHNCRGVQKDICPNGRPTSQKGHTNTILASIEKWALQSLIRPLRPSKAL